jgi:O-antigen ligase
MRIGSLMSINRCDIFLLIWVLYYLQGTAYEEGSAFSTGLLIVNLLISAVCAIKVMQMKDAPVYFRGVNLLMLMFTVYGFWLICNPPTSAGVSGILNQIPSYGYIKSIYLSLLPIYAFYYFSRQGYLTVEKLRFWGLIFLVSTVFSYYRYQQEVLEKLINHEEIVNNAGYLFLSCIPLLVVYRKKPLLQFILLAFVMMYIVMGMKRGAIAIGALTAVYFIVQAIRNTSGRTRFVLVLLSAALVVIAIQFFLYRMATSEFMMDRFQRTMEGYSSGRDDLYSFFWTYFTHQADTLHYLFGRGANGTLEIYYNYAHNDWLEVAVNQGLLGLAVYFIYWKHFYKTWRWTTNKDAKAILAMFIIIYFAKTMFSMSYGDMTYVCTSVLGFALANRNNADIV